VAVELAVAVMPELAVAPVLAVTMAEVPAEKPGWLGPAQVAAWGGGGLFALLYAGSLIRARRRG
jgi:hypothetical protein